MSFTDTLNSKFVNNVCNDTANAQLIFDAMNAKTIATNITVSCINAMTHTMSTWIIKYCPTGNSTIVKRTPSVCINCVDPCLLAVDKEHSHQWLMSPCSIPYRSNDNFVTGITIEFVNKVTITINVNTIDTTNNTYYIGCTTDY